MPCTYCFYKGGPSGIKQNFGSSSSVEIEKKEFCVFDVVGGEVGQKRALSEITYLCNEKSF